MPSLPEWFLSIEVVSMSLKFPWSLYKVTNKNKYSQGMAYINLNINNGRYIFRLESTKQTAVKWLSLILILEKIKLS